MKKLILVTMLLHFVTFLFAQNHYADYPDANIEEIGSFEINYQATGKLERFGGIFRTPTIQNLFGGSSDFVDFKVYYKISKTQIKSVAHGKVRTNLQFSTPLHEAGIYYAIFEPESGLKKLLYLDAKTLDIQIYLATQKL